MLLVALLLLGQRDRPPEPLQLLAVVVVDRGDDLARPDASAGSDRAGTRAVDEQAVEPARDHSPQQVRDHLRPQPGRDLALPHVGLAALHRAEAPDQPARGT